MEGATNRTSVRVGGLDDLPPGGAVRVDVDGTPVAVFNVGGTLYAIADTCSHEEASLAEGFLEDEIVECPKHGAQFDVKTGKNLTLPATRPVRAYVVRVEGTDVYVEAND